MTREDLVLLDEELRDIKRTSNNVIRNAQLQRHQKLARFYSSIFKTGAQFEDTFASYSTVKKKMCTITGVSIKFDMNSGTGDITVTFCVDTVEWCRCADVLFYELAEGIITIKE